MTSKDDYPPTFQGGTQLNSNLTTPKQFDFVKRPLSFHQHFIKLNSDYYVQKKIATLLKLRLCKNLYKINGAIWRNLMTTHNVILVKLHCIQSYIMII